MRDKIAEVIADNNPHSFAPEGTSLVNIYNLTKEILDLIAKELPKEKESSFNADIFEDGYNQCLKDIKHKLEVE